MLKSFMCKWPLKDGWLVFVEKKATEKYQIGRFYGVVTALFLLSNPRERDQGQECGYTIQKVTFELVVALLRKGQ